jgi:hypothetical protein
MSYTNGELDTITEE